jgi:hypothetical protein
VVLVSKTYLLGKGSRGAKHVGNIVDTKKIVIAKHVYNEVAEETLSFHDERLINLNV